MGKLINERTNNQRDVLVGLRSSVYTQHRIPFPSLKIDYFVTIK